MFPQVLPKRTAEVSHQDIYAITEQVLADVDNSLDNLDSRIQGVSKKVRVDQPELALHAIAPATNSFEQAVCASGENLIFIESEIPGFFTWPLLDCIPKSEKIVHVGGAQPSLFREFITDFYSSLNPLDTFSISLRSLNPNSFLFKQILQNFGEENLTAYFSISASQYSLTPTGFYNTTDNLLTALVIQFAKPGNSLEIYKTFANFIALYDNERPLCLTVNIKDQELSFHNLNIYTLLMILRGDERLASVYNNIPPEKVLRECLIVCPNLRKVGTIPFGHSSCRLLSNIPLESYTGAEAQQKCEAIAQYQIPQRGFGLIYTESDKMLNFSIVDIAEHAQLKEMFFVFLRTQNYKLRQQLAQVSQKILSQVTNSNFSKHPLYELLQVIQATVNPVTIQDGSERLRPQFSRYPYLHHFFNFALNQSYHDLFKRYCYRLVFHLAIPFKLDCIKDSLSPHDFIMGLMNTPFEWEAYTAHGRLSRIFFLKTQALSPQIPNLGQLVCNGAQLNPAIKTKPKQQDVQTICQIRVISETFDDLELKCTEKVLTLEALETNASANSTLNTLLKSIMNLESDGVIYRSQFVNPPPKKIRFKIHTSPDVSISFASKINLGPFFVNPVSAVYNIKKTKKENVLQLDLDICPA